VVSDEPIAKSEAEAGTLTDRIFARFSEALLASKQFDAETVRQFVALANRESPPKASDIEKLLQQGERLE
jgi:hypothetical protein